jgi:hypothetical protein
MASLRKIAIQARAQTRAMTAGGGILGSSTAHGQINRPSFGPLGDR